VFTFYKSFNSIFHIDEEYNFGTKHIMLFCIYPLYLTFKFIWKKFEVIKSSKNKVIDVHL